MSIYRQRPSEALRPFIDWLWYYVDFQPDHDREHVLPDGTFELMINLQEVPRKLFERGASGRFQAFKRGWVSGAQTQYLVIDALPSSSMIGVHFKPGGAGPFLGRPADEFSGQVVELDSLWGDPIWGWRDRLLAAEGPAAKFQVMEQLLTAKMSRKPPGCPGARAARWALDRFVDEPHLHAVAEVSAQLGMSHKHFIDQFKRQVGLTPKKFCRIRRFHQVLAQIQTRHGIDWPDLACACGYYDQAHFINDFVGFSGMNPSAYLTHRIEGDPKFVRASA
jgi:AraC-like DNA-binding protein